MLLLVESRIVESAKRRGDDFMMISRWIQDVLQPHEEFNLAIQGVSEFCKRMEDETSAARRNGMKNDLAVAEGCVEL